MLPDVSVLREFALPSSVYIARLPFLSVVLDCMYQSFFFFFIAIGQV